MRLARFFEGYTNLCMKVRLALSSSRFLEICADGHRCVNELVHGTSIHTATPRERVIHLQHASSKFECSFVNAFHLLNSSFAPRTSHLFSTTSSHHANLPSTNHSSSAAF